VQIELQSGELRINTWSVLYRSPGGRKFNGKLTITNKRLLYDAPFDMGAKGVIPEIMFIKWGSTGYLEISKADIRTLEIKKQVFGRRAELTLVDGSKHVFVYGVLTGSQLARAINSN